MNTKQAEYVYSNCKNEEVIGSEQVYKCEKYNKTKVDLQLNPYEYGMLNDFELYNINTESPEIYKWSISIPKLITLNIIEKNCHKIE